MSPDTQIYDVETYQPAGCVGQLMYRVRSAQMSALDEALAQDPDLNDLRLHPLYKNIRAKVRRMQAHKD